jgi:hypothetical protein
MSKGLNTEKPISPLIPTKAALFGLDLRFVAIEKELANKRLKRRGTQNPTDISF